MPDSVLSPNSPSAKDIAYHLHSYTNFAAHEQQGPMIIRGGDGCYVMDEDGKRYLEGMGGLWCCALGFSEKRLAAAAYRQMTELPYYHSFTSRGHRPAIDLAEKLIGMVPVPMSKVFFANSGSEATDSVIKMVWYYHNAIGQPQKKKIISRIRGYHGVTLAAASMTGLPVNHKHFDLPIDRIVHTTAPHYYRQGRAGETETQFATRCAEDLEDLIIAEGPDTVAAFIAEPIMGAGGVIVPPATYFEKIQAVLRKYDILFIADEVICGFGRTGHMFATETFDLQPDFLTLAKQLSAGYAPISAVLVNDKVYQGLKIGAADVGAFGHGFTYSAHPVSCAIALEALRIYEADGILEHVREIIPHFQERLHALGEVPIVGEARGLGLIGAVELVADKATKRPFNPVGQVGAEIMNAAREYGLMVRAIQDNIAFCPPMIITHDQIDELFDLAERALKR